MAGPSQVALSAFWTGPPRFWRRILHSPWFDVSPLLFYESKKWGFAHHQTLNHPERAERVEGIKHTIMKRITHYEGKFKRFVSENGWEFAERIHFCGVVAILPVTEDRKIILVEQYRPPVGKRVIEFPAGMADGANGHESESLEEAARRELLEETGFEAREMVRCVSGPTAAASSPDIMTIFLARGLKKVAEGGGDATESIIVHEVLLSEVERWLSQKEKEGLAIDPKIYAGLYLIQKNF